MLLLFSIREGAFVKFCVCPSFPFGIEGMVWDVIVLIPDHCLSICQFYSFFLEGKHSFNSCGFPITKNIRFNLF